MNGTEIITILSSSLENIGSVVNTVVGALITAIFLRHNTKTDEFEKIKAGKFKEVVDELLTSRKMTYVEYYRANNFLSIAKKADLYYQDHSSSDAKSTYDFDWFVRFFEAAGNISDETMQNLWAKILAGEIAHPSSFSLKTIDVMRNLSKKDAELFIKICSHSFKSNYKYFLPKIKEYLESVNITYEDIMKLSELGLMFNDGLITLNINISNDPCIMIHNHNLIMMISSSSGKNETANLAQYPFTEVGKELSTLIDESTSDEDFMRYGEVLSNNKSYKISVHKIIQWKEASVSYDEQDIMQIDTSAHNNE